MVLKFRSIATFWSHKFTTVANLFKIGRASRVKQRTMTHKKRKGFIGNKGKHLTNVYNKSNVNIVNNVLESTHTTSVNMDTTDIQNCNIYS